MDINWNLVLILTGIVASLFAAKYAKTSLTPSLKLRKSFATVKKKGDSEFDIKIFLLFQPVDKHAVIQDARVDGQKANVNESGRLMGDKTIYGNVILPGEAKDIKIFATRKERPKNKIKVKIFIPHGNFCCTVTDIREL